MTSGILEESRHIVKGMIDTIERDVIVEHQTDAEK
jgi:hypothetical protein